METTDNNKLSLSSSSGNISSSDKNNNCVELTSTDFYERYEFPVLAEGIASFTQARLDPLACNINNDAVLVWNDVIYHRRDVLPVEKSLSGASIEDVFQELQNTAEARLIARNGEDDLWEGVGKEGDCENIDQHPIYENPVVARRRLIDQGYDHLLGPNLESDRLTAGDTATGENGFPEDVTPRSDIMVTTNKTSLDGGDITGENLRLDSGHYDDDGVSFDLSTFNPNTDFITGDGKKDCAHQEEVGDYDNGFYEQKEKASHCLSSETHLDSRVCYRPDPIMAGDSEVFIESGAEASNEVVFLPHLNSKRRIRPGVCKHVRKSKETTSHKDKEIPWRDESSVMVECQNQSCGKNLNLAEARKSYKNCHHCLRTYYCSRDCRRRDWVRHKDLETCPGSCVSSACKKVIRYCNSDPEVKAVLSRLATRGYLSHGRGCILLGFPDLECTEEFLEYRFPMLELNPIYVSVRELSESKMYGNVLEKLVKTCKAYKPEAKFVLNVGVGLLFNRNSFTSSSSFHDHHGHHRCYDDHSHIEPEVGRCQSLGSDLGYASLSNSLINVSKEIITPSRNSSNNSSCSHCYVYKNFSNYLRTSRHKGPILQKFIKLRLAPVCSQEAHEKRWTFEDHPWDMYRTTGPTLILTSIPECSDGKSESRKRELTFINIQRKLRQRNVDLRQQYPSVHAHLIDYVTTGAHFPSQVLFPMDVKAGKTFTCFMMPEAEAELEWMQSHYLLNDLQLSKDSLSNSMSRSLSSSMPSIVSQSFPTVKSNHFTSPPARRAARNNKLLDTASRSHSLTQLHHRVRFDDNCITKSKSFDSVSALEADDIEIKPLSKTRSHRQHDGLEKSDNNNIGRINVSRLQRDFSENQKELQTPLQQNVWKNQTVSQNSLDTSPYLDDAFKENTSPNLDSSIFKENNLQSSRDLDIVMSAANEATPSFYPVRKAKNVKLYSSSHSLPPRNSVPTSQQQQKQKQQENMSSTSLSSSLPLLSSSSPSLPNLSPALLTSTPLTKTSNHQYCYDGLDPDPSRLNPSRLSPCQIRCPPYSKTLPSQDRKSQEHSRIPSAQHPIQSYDSFSSEFDKNNKMHLKSSPKFMPYGCDPASRRKVVVDEVDRMKRRRKGQGQGSNDCIVSLPNGSGLEECDWLESSGPMSPPLATSTMCRNRDARVERIDYCHRKYQHKKKQKGNYSRSGIGSGRRYNDDDDDDVDDDDCNGNDFNFNRNVRGTEQIISGSYQRHDKDGRNLFYPPTTTNPKDGQSYNDSTCIVNSIPPHGEEQVEHHYDHHHGSYMDNVHLENSRTRTTRSNDQKDGHTTTANTTSTSAATMDVNGPQLSASFRRKFNTNSPYFPRGSKLTLPSPLIRGEKNDNSILKKRREIENNHDDLHETKRLNCYDVSGSSSTKLGSHLYTPDTLSSIGCHTYPSDTPRTGCHPYPQELQNPPPPPPAASSILTTTSPTSSPPKSTTTTPKDTQTSPPSTHHVTSPSRNSHAPVLPSHHRLDFTQHPIHLRMRVLNDVTHSSTNQKTLNFPEPTTSCLISDSNTSQSDSPKHRHSDQRPFIPDTHNARESREWNTSNPSHNSVSTIGYHTPRNKVGSCMPVQNSSHSIRQHQIHTTPNHSYSSDW